MRKFNLAMATIIAFSSSSLLNQARAADADTAQDESSKEDKESSSEKLIKDLEALTEAIEDTRTKETDTIAGEGGQMEAAILSASAIQKAGTEIAEAIDLKSPIIVGLNDTLSIDDYLAFEAELYGVQTLLNAVPGGPPPRVPGVTEGGGAAAPVLAALIPFFSSLLRSETEISDMAGSLTDDRILALAVGQALQGHGKPTIPSAMIVTKIDPSNPIIQELKALQDLRNEVAARPKSDARDAALKRYEDFIAAITKSDDEGHVKLASILKAQKLAAALQAPNARVLRVHIEKAGGTVLKRKNLAVTLGASGIGITGGLIATYSETTPDSGVMDKSGVVVCQTALKSMKQVHSWDGRGSKCRHAATD